MSAGIQTYRAKDSGIETPMDMHSLYIMHHSGQSKKALEICTGLLANTENANNIYLLDLHSLILFGTQEYAECLQVAEKSWGICQNAGNEWLRLQQRIRQARALIALERYNIAEERLLLAFSELENIRDKWAEALCTMLNGITSFRCQRYDKSIKLFHKAYDMFSTYGDVEDMAMCCINVANVYDALLEQAKSLNYLSKAIELKEIYRRSIEYSVTGGYGKILPTYDGYLRLPRKGDKSLGDAYISYAVSLSVLGDHETALEYCQKALELKKSSGDTMGISVVYNTIGVTAIGAAQLDTAEYYLNEGLKQLAIKDSIYYRAVITMNLARIYTSRGLYDSAEEYYDNALNLFQTIGDNYTIAFLYSKLAQLNLEQQRKAQAQLYLDKGIAIAKELALVSELVEMQTTLAKILVQSGTTKARELLNQTLLIADEYKLIQGQIDIHKELASLYKIDGNTAQALYHFERFHQLKEALFTQESDQRLKNMHILHEVEQHKRKAEESENAVRTLKSELEKKTRELTAFALRITEKQELLDTLHIGLRGIIDASSDTKNGIALELLRIVESADTRQRDWTEFSRHFADLHQHFTENMAKLFPELSPTELKVCALLRLNMSTKQIAGIMHVSDRAVENHRLRLRKKLGLHRDDNLTKRLLEI